MSLESGKKHGLADAGLFSFMARKSSYTPKIAQDICERIASGKSLVSVCKKLKLTYSTVTRWLEQFEEFRTKYALAREAQADYLADEIIDVADNCKLHPDDKRVRIDARKWKAGKMKPKVYGEKIELSGGFKLTHEQALEQLDDPDDAA